VSNETAELTTPPESPVAKPSGEYQVYSLLSRISRTLSTERGPGREERDTLVREINEVLQAHLLEMLSRM
jgi:hypothetical protein